MERSRTQSNTKTCTRGNHCTKLSFVTLFSCNLLEMDYIIEEFQLVDQVVLVFQLNHLVFVKKKNNNKLKGVIFFAYFLYSFLDYQSIYTL